MDINELEKIVIEIAKEKKWGTTPDEINFGEKIARLHAEVSEVLEAYIKNNIKGKNSLTEELADVLMRVVHLAAIYDIDLEKQIVKKIEDIKKRDWSNDKFYIDRANKK